MSSALPIIDMARLRQHSRESYELALENAGGEFTLRPDGRVQGAFRGAEEWLGYFADDLRVVVGKPGRYRIPTRAEVEYEAKRGNPFATGNLTEQAQLIRRDPDLAKLLANRPGVIDRVAAPVRDLIGI